MASIAVAAKEFVDGPAIPEAAHKLLKAFSVADLCEALANAQGTAREVFISALERLAGIEDVCSAFCANSAVAHFLKQGAASDDNRLTRLVARLFERLASTEAGAEILASLGLYNDVEVLLLHEEIGTAEAASRTICRAAQWPVGRETAFTDLVQRLHSRLQDLRETERIRVLALFVELGRVSETDVFPALEERGCFKSVLAAFLTDDILLKLNAVELMDALGSYQAGQELLSQHDVPGKLAADLADPCCDESVRLCVVRLLGLIILRAPAALSSLLTSQQAPLPQGIASFLDSRSPIERLCGLEAFSNIAAHQDGLQFFLQWPAVMNNVVAAVTSTNNDACKAGMVTWAAVLNTRQPQSGAGALDAQVWQLAEEQVLPSAIKALITKPFHDVRACTWRLLAVFARSQKATRKVLVADEMREKLLDFSSESDSDAKIAKHEFIRSLVKCQGTWLAAFLDENIEMMLSEYAKQGPFWMPQVAAVGLANQAS